VLAARSAADPSRWEAGGDAVDQWLPAGLPLEVGREAIAQAAERWA
jgi:hypothetical protein